MQNENIAEKQDGEKTRITTKFAPLNYFKFLVLNFVVAVVPIILMFYWLSTKEESFIIALYAAGITFLIFILQYPLLVYIKTWIGKFVVLYLSMCVFFFIFGFTGSMYEREGVFSMQKIIQHLSDGMIMILLGHIFGIIFFPVVAFVNWLMRKQLFVYEREIIGE